MSASSTSQSASVFHTNKCSPAVRKKVKKNPDTPEIWDTLVRNYIGSGSGNRLEPELDKSHHHIHLSGLKRWKAGDEQAKGSALHLEHFLHLRALIQNHDSANFPLRDLVDPKYADAAEGFLAEWPDFRRYIDQVPINDPAMDLDSLGVFSGAKRVQNQVLLDPYLGTFQGRHRDQDEEDSFKDSTSETPLKRGSPEVGVDFNANPTHDDAADEQIVNEALISFASVLTRRWMIQRTSAPYATDVTPTRGGTGAYGWRTAADWTMSRDRFHIRARLRQNEPVQGGHMAGLMESRKRRKDDLEQLSDGHFYGRVSTSEIDGSLYSIGRNSTEILAIVEVKKRLRAKNRLPIEWQEASEVLAWLNMRLRDEAGANGGSGKGSSTARRGMLRSKSAVGSSGEKSRCLLVAQDREEVYLVIGEWDILYEEYALEGRFSGTTIKVLESLHKNAGPAGCDAGFLTLHVYGPFGSCRGGALARSSSMRDLSTNLLALSLHLSEASCSPVSRRPTPPASIQLSTPRGEPCCPDCTCRCRCKPPPGSRGTSKTPPKPPSETSESRRGGQQAPREESASREPGKKTPSIHSNSSHSSGGPDPTPSRAPRPGGRRPDEIRAASAHAQQDPGQVHGSLPLRGRPMAGEQRGPRSESQEQASRSRSRARAAAAAAAAGHQGQGPGPGPAAGSRHPPLPQAPGGSFPAPGQQRQPQAQQQQQQHEQRDAHGQSGHGAQPHRDPRVAPADASTQHQAGTAGTQPQPRPQTRAQTAGHPQQERHDPSSGPGPSYSTQAGPSRQRPQARPARLEVGEPSQSQQNPEEAPIKNEKKNHPLSPKTWRLPKIGKDKKDKEGKGKGKKDEGGGGKK